MSTLSLRGITLIKQGQKVIDDLSLEFGAGEMIGVICDDGTWQAFADALTGKANFQGEVRFGDKHIDGRLLSKHFAVASWPPVQTRSVFNRQRKDAADFIRQIAAKRCVLLSSLNVHTPLGNLPDSFKSQGMSVLFRHKDGSSFLLCMADSFVVLVEGKLQQHASPLEVYRRPRTPAAAKATGRCNFFAGELLNAGGGEALVQTKIGLLRGALANPDADPAPGTHAEVLVRPECWHIDRFPPEENCAEVTVQSTQYFGATALLTVATEQGVAFDVLELNPTRPDGPQSECYCWAAPEDVVVFA